MKCPKCGAENIENAQFCNLCLESFTSKKAPEPKKDEHVAGKAISSTVPAKDTKAKKIIVKQAWENFNFTDFLLPPVIAAAGAFVLTFFIPKDVPVFYNAGNRPLGLILLSAVAGGWVIVSSYKPLVPKRLITGFLIGVSAVFLGYIMTILSWIILVKTNPTLFTKYSMGLESLVLPILLAIGIALSDQIEQFHLKEFAVIASVSLLGGILAIVFSKFIPGVHVLVYTGFFCWVLIPIVKRLLP